MSPERLGLVVQALEDGEGDAGRTELLVTQVGVGPRRPDQSGQGTDDLQGDGLADGHDRLQLVVDTQL